jgi:hypothetical protein
MAGDWLKIEASTPDKPEVFLIAQALQMTPEEAFGRLFKVWRYFDQHTRDGNELGVSDSYIDHIAGVTGFGKAMRDVHWLDWADNNMVGVKLVNFDRHHGKTAKTRALTARRVATHKQRSGNGAQTQGALPREEKRRIKTIGGDSSPESQNLGRYWELPDDQLVEKARLVGVNTRGETRQQILQAMRDKLAKPVEKAA